MLVFLRFDSRELDIGSGVLFKGGACPVSVRTQTFRGPLVIFFVVIFLCYRKWFV